MSGFDDAWEDSMKGTAVKEAELVNLSFTIHSVEWREGVKDGKTIRYLSILSVTGEDVTPNAFDEEMDKPDGQFRSPKDFRRTSALAQAVARHSNAPAHSDEDIILTAQRFEVYLASGT